MPISLFGISFSIDAWIYRTAFPNPLDQSIFGICPFLANDECLYLTIRKISFYYNLYFGLFGDACPGSALLTPNTWTHVAFVFEVNSRTQSIYINGQLDATRTATIGNIPMLSSNSSYKLLSSTSVVDPTDACLFVSL